MIEKKEIISERILQEKLCGQYKAELKKLPEGKLFFKNEHGRKRAYLYNDGKERYISLKEQQLIFALKKKKKLEDAIICFEENIEILKLMEKGYKEFSPFLLELGEGNSFKQEIKYVNGNSEFLEGTNEYKFENRKHITPKGVKVRSKSELIIATFLEAKGIEFKYEAHLKLAGKSIYPDFVVVRKSDGRLIIWEHFGMMDDEIYRKKAFEKIQNYIENGYIPYDNLIVTFGDGDSGIDMGIIENIIETMLR